MAVKKTDRDQLIDCGLDPFRVNGHHHTPMADVGVARSLLEGSGHHDPRRKNQLAMAVPNRAIQRGERRPSTLAGDGGPNRAGREVAALLAARPDELSEGTPRQ